jgi:hypothetical protein
MTRFAAAVRDRFPEAGRTTQVAGAAGSGIRRSAGINDTSARSFDKEPDFVKQADTMYH